MKGVDDRTKGGLQATLCRPARGITYAAGGIRRLASMSRDRV